MTGQPNYYLQASLRTLTALTSPESPEEKAIETLLNVCSDLAERHKDDTVLVGSVEHVGSAIIVLLNGEVGRLDQGVVDSMVRAIVATAGGDPDGL